MTPNEIAKRLGRDVVEVERSVERVRLASTPRAETHTVYERGRKLTLDVTRRGVGRLKVGKRIAFGCEVASIPLGYFEHFDFAVGDRWEKYSAVVLSPLSDLLQPIIFPGGPILLRIDSGCETGQLFGDVTCECREQLELALERISAFGSGLLISIPRQDGRGMGLPFKLATLSLQQDLGVNTVEAASLIEPNAQRDVRTYAGVLAILRYFGADPTTPIRVLTNNDKKLEVFKENGYLDVEDVALVVPPTDDTRPHLQAKQDRLGHKSLMADRSPRSRPTRPRFATLVRESIRKKNSILCVGLDPDPKRLPPEVLSEGRVDYVSRFLCTLVETTIRRAAAYKLNKAFFDVLPNGACTLQEVVVAIKDRDDTVPIIIDCKIGDVPHTMLQYEALLFDELGADAVFVNPYLGPDVWRNVGESCGARGVLVRTSNPTASAVQDLRLADGRLVWQAILDLLIAERQHDLFPVVSLESVADAQQVRCRVPDDLPIFVAGIGAQGKDAAVVSHLLDAEGGGVLVGSSRAIIYPPAVNGSWTDAVAGAAETTWTMLQGMRHAAR